MLPNNDKDILKIQSKETITENGTKVTSTTYLWLVGNGRMVVIVVIIVPHSSIPY